MLTADRQCMLRHEMYFLPPVLIWLESRNHAGKRNDRRRISPGKIEATYITTWDLIVRLDWTKLVKHFSKLM